MIKALKRTATFAGHGMQAWDTYWIGIGRIWDGEEDHRSPVQQPVRLKYNKPVMERGDVHWLRPRGIQPQLAPMGFLPARVQVEYCCETPPVNRFLTVYMDGKARPIACQYRRTQTILSMHAGQCCRGLQKRVGDTPQRKITL